MKKLQEIDRLVEEAIEALENAGLKDFRNFRKQTLTTLARKCAEINSEDFPHFSNTPITDYNSRLRDGQVETPEPKQEEKPALQPLPKKMPEWFMDQFHQRHALENWKQVIQHFGTQPREWWQNLKKGDDFMYDNGVDWEKRTFSGVIYLAPYAGMVCDVNKCSPYTDPAQSFRDKLTPEMQVEFDKLMEGVGK